MSRHELTTVRNQVDHAERVLADAKQRLLRLERPEPRAVMVALPGTANHYAYLVPDHEPMPLDGAPVACPQPFGGGYMIGRVVEPRRGEDLSRATVECRNIAWDIAYDAE